MKNLNEIASQYNLFQSNKIPKDWIEYWDNNMNDYQKSKGIVLPQFIVENKNFEIGLFFECKIQDAGTDKEFKYIDNNYILVKYIHSETICIVKYESRSKKYILNPLYNLYSKYYNVLGSMRNEVYKSVNSPNLIGVFTEKKLIDWVTYCTDLVNAFESKYNEVNNKINDGQIEIDNFIKSLDGKNAKIERFKNKTYIETNLFYISLTLDSQSGYLSNEIRYKGGLKDIIEITK